MEDFVLRWNVTYPLDRWLRKKYNIRFNSKEHRETNLVDAYFEYIEEKTYNQLEKEISLKKEKSNKYKKEGWITEPVININDDTFDNIDYTLFDDDIT
jgi:hypothetical protein